VRLVDGRDLTYDVLVIATGAVLASDETEGLTGRLDGEGVHFYTPEGATASRGAGRVQGGRIVVNIVDMRSSARRPLEFCS